MFAISRAVNSYLDTNNYSPQANMGVTGLVCLAYLLLVKFP